MTDQDNEIALATKFTIAWLSNPNTRTGLEEATAFFRSMKNAIGTSSTDAVADAEKSPEQFAPAVTVRKSLASRDHIISMIDGKKYKALKRHLTTNGLTPDEYRERYKLNSDYPMIAPSYSDARRAMAVRNGLGSRGSRRRPQSR